MCDTLGRLLSGSAVFAKNSDRSPNEIQLTEFYPARSGLSGELACTYITVPQASETYSVLLSRPGWMWGAEIGVNEFGLCIGNEAVFTKGAYGKTGLTGMDLLRLALERCRNAQDAVSLITELLQQYGQGGNCGYDHDFYYDNAFLIMDRTALYVLETCGKEWVCKQYSSVSISNRLSIGADGDRYSGAVCDFCKKHTEPIYTTFSGSGHRKAQTARFLGAEEPLAGCMAALRSHDHGVADPFAKGTVSSACMHYGGMIGDHTTASMVVSLEANRTIVWTTGSSAPCVSLFKPWLFGCEAVLPVTSSGSTDGAAYWLDAEHFRRSLLGKRLPKEFYTQRDTIQQRWLLQAAQTSATDFPAFSRTCLAEEAEFFRIWRNRILPGSACGAGFRKRWEKKNQILFG
ncbi:MAG: peptidase U34 [Ruminococcaceae bacterium]|nr:peptidase U34 [Oscillospiraceae bacterium]